MARRTAYDRELQQFIRGPPIVKLCVLASSSAGNSIFLATEKARILIDAGLSRRETFARLAAIGESPEQLDAILITHEHCDHVAGLPALMKKVNCPVFLTELTAHSITWSCEPDRIQKFQAGTSFSVGDIEVDSFSIPHDAIDPVGYRFSVQGIRVAIATDLGYVPENIKFYLRGADIMLLESNHDLEMLKVGPYPWSVKQRVMGRRGHLSNDVAFDYIAADMDSSVSTLILGHISENNNHPALVEQGARMSLDGRSLTTRLVVAEPGKQTEAFVY